MSALSRAEATRMIEAAMAEYPTLGANGFTDFRHDREESADMLTPMYVSQFIRAYAYMAIVPRTKRVNRDASSSYGLKHLAERWWGAWLEENAPGHRRSYIANGMLIAAAHALGFIIQPVGTINAFFNIAKRPPEPPGYHGYKTGTMLDFSAWMPDAVGDELESVA